MRIAVTYKDGQVFQHFGRSEFFKIYDVKEGQIISQGTAEEVYHNQSLESAFGVKIEKLQTKEGKWIWHYSHFL